jgi:hypothetical protein
MPGVQGGAPGPVSVQNRAEPQELVVQTSVCQRFAACVQNSGCGTDGMPGFGRMGVRGERPAI